MMPFESAQIPQRLNDDPEFALCARYWTGAVRLRVGEHGWMLRITDGRVTGFDSAEAELAPGDIEVSAPEEAWRTFLQAIPPPFYHDLVAASLHHEFGIGGDMETFFAYYPAIRRLFDVLRQGD